MEEWVKRSASILAEDGERLKERPGAGKGPLCRREGRGPVYPPDPHESFRGGPFVPPPGKILRLPGVLRLIMQKEAPSFLPPLPPKCTFPEKKAMLDRMQDRFPPDSFPLPFGNLFRKRRFSVCPTTDKARRKTL